VPIIAKKERSDFVPSPPGLWAGVCCDVVDLGMVETQWGKKHRVQLRWLVDAQPPRSDGKPYMVSKKYTLSLHEKANLRIMLEVWRNKKFTADELDGFDLEKLVGAPCQIQVAQEHGDEGPFSFPQVVLKANELSRPVQIPSDYVRACNRPDYKAPIQESESQEAEYAGDFSAGQIDDSDIPF